VREGPRRTGDALVRRRSNRRTAVARSIGREHLDLRRVIVAAERSFQLQRTTGACPCRGCLRWGLGLSLGVFLSVFGHGSLQMQSLVCVTVR